MNDCARCGLAPAVNDGFCVHCLLRVHEEAVDGLILLQEMLRCHADFQAWESAHAAGRSA